MTGDTLTALLLLAVTAAASPFSLVAFSLVLATDRGPRNGIAFIAGWLVTVMLIGVAVAWLGQATTPKSHHHPGAWTFALELALGATLVILWLRRRRRPAGERLTTPQSDLPQPAKPQPAWQRHLSTMGYGGAFVAGGLVQTWPVMIAAAVDISRLNLGIPVGLAWMFLFTVATTLGIDALEVLAWRSPGSAAERLERIETYVASHRDSVINWLYLIAGLWLFFRGLIGLV